MNGLKLRSTQDQQKQMDEINLLKIENNKLKSELHELELMSTNLLKSEKKFEQLFHNITDAVYYLKINEDGTASAFMEVNEVGYTRLGYTREEILRMSPFDIDFHEKEELIQILQSIKKNKTMTFETIHICKDGRSIPVEIKTNLLDIQGELFTLSVCRDISERKLAEEFKIQAEKMNVVAQLAAGIAHEIRNPLTSLKGFLQLFKEGFIPDEHILTIIENELERINTISGEFLTLAKPYNLNFSPLDLLELLQNVIDLFETDASSKAIKIMIEHANEKIMVNGNAKELRKMFVNLIKNAIEAMPNGGKVQINIEIKDSFVYISIQDNGIGMTEEQLKRLGEPFFTMKETGTGLGMMITFKIIQNHHGEIHVDSKVNKGTTFTVKLPAIK